MNSTKTGLQNNQRQQSEDHEDRKEEMRDDQRWCSPPELNRYIYSNQINLGRQYQHCFNTTRRILKIRKLHWQSWWEITRGQTTNEPGLQLVRRSFIVSWNLLFGTMILFSTVVNVPHMTGAFLFIQTAYNTAIGAFRCLTREMEWMSQRGRGERITGIRCF